MDIKFTQWRHRRPESSLVYRVSKKTASLKFFIIKEKKGRKDVVNKIFKATN